MFLKLIFFLVFMVFGRNLTGINPDKILSLTQPNNFNVSLLNCNILRLHMHLDLWNPNNYQP